MREEAGSTMEAKSADFFVCACSMWGRQGQKKRRKQSPWQSEALWFLLSDYCPFQEAAAHKQMIKKSWRRNHDFPHLTVAHSPKRLQMHTNSDQRGSGNCDEEGFGMHCFTGFNIVN